MRRPATMLNFDLDSVPTVTVRRAPAFCARCRRPADADSLLVVAEVDRVERALGEALETGRSTEFGSLGWICSECALKEATCPRCGGPLAGMPARPYIIDGGQVVGNPFWPDPEPILPKSCLTEGCPGYVAAGAERFHQQRRHAVGYQGFPDAYQGLLGDLGVKPGEEGPFRGTRNGKWSLR